MAEACNNKNLKHVDISYNSMNEKECEIFGEIIHDNHTLWGLHMLGNECLLDSMGFIKVGIKSTSCSRDILHTPMKQATRFIKNISNASKSLKIKSFRNCWVCEGWTE